MELKLEDVMLSSLKGLANEVGLEYPHDITKKDLIELIRKKDKDPFEGKNSSGSLSPESAPGKEPAEPQTVDSPPTDLSQQYERQVKFVTVNQFSARSEAKLEEELKGWSIAGVAGIGSAMRILCTRFEPADEPEQSTESPRPEVVTKKTEPEPMSELEDKDLDEVFHF